MFEVVESIDRKARPGAPVEEAVLGTFVDVEEATAFARSAREQALGLHIEDYVWWVVRPVGSRLAHWIADSTSEKEFVLDLRSGELIQVH